MQIRCGPFSLVQSGAPNRSGRHFWLFQRESAEYGFQDRSSELEWFVDMLAKLASCSPLTVARDPGLYPIGLRLAPGGGPGWFVHVGERGQALVLRRFTDSFKAAPAVGQSPAGGDRVQYLSYLNYMRFGRYPLQL